MNIKDILEYGYCVDDNNLVIKIDKIPDKYINKSQSLAENIESWLDAEY